MNLFRNGATLQGKNLLLLRKIPSLLKSKQFQKSVLSLHVYPLTDRMTTEEIIYALGPSCSKLIKSLVNVSLKL